MALEKMQRNPLKGESSIVEKDWYVNSTAKQMPQLHLPSVLFQKKLHPQIHGCTWQENNTNTTTPFIWAI